jgi:hypothetical protein
MMARERHDVRTGRDSTERAYFIVGNPNASASAVARVIRDHWGIENELHWVLDTTFSEDQRPVRAGHAAQNLVILRHLAMNLMRARPRKKRSMVKRRQRCGRPFTTRLTPSLSKGSPNRQVRRGVDQQAQSLARQLLPDSRR